MNYWIIKTEPSTYSWNNLLKDKKTFWNGVRNFQARNNLKKMEVGDLAFFYHSGDEKSIAGIAKVAKSAYPDHTADDPQWVMVDVEAVKTLNTPVELSLIKEVPELKNIKLVRQGRLSVSEITKTEFDLILNLGKTKI